MSIELPPLCPRTRTCSNIINPTSLYPISPSLNVRRKSFNNAPVMKEEVNLNQKSGDCDADHADMLLSRLLKQRKERLNQKLGLLRLTKKNSQNQRENEDFNQNKKTEENASLKSEDASRKRVRFHSKVTVITFKTTATCRPRNATQNKRTHGVENQASSRTDAAPQTECTWTALLARSLFWG